MEEEEEKELQFLLLACCCYSSVNETFIEVSLIVWPEYLVLVLLPAQPFCTREEPLVSRRQPLGISHPPLVYSYGM